MFQCSKVVLSCYDFIHLYISDNLALSEKVKDTLSQHCSDRILRQIYTKKEDRKVLNSVWKFFIAWFLLFLAVITVKVIRTEEHDVFGEDWCSDRERDLLGFNIKILLLRPTSVTYLFMIIPLRLSKPFWGPGWYETTEGDVERFAGQSTSISSLDLNSQSHFHWPGPNRRDPDIYTK